MGMMATTRLALISPAHPVTTIASVVGLAVVSFVFLRLGPAAQMRARCKIPEAGFSYKAADIKDCLRRLGGNSRLYRDQLHWDSIYVVLYGTGLTFWIDGTWGRVLRSSHGESVSWLIVLPVVVLALSDLIENWLLLRVVSVSGEIRHENSVGWAQRATRVKWATLAVVGLAVMVGALVLAFRGPSSL